MPTQENIQDDMEEMAEAEDFIAWSKREKTKRFRRIIKKSRQSCSSSKLDFIDSCEDFLDENGFLTPRQISALEAPEDYPRSGSRGRRFYDYDFEPDELDFNDLWFYS